MSFEWQNTINVEEGIIFEKIITTDNVYPFSSKILLVGNDLKAQEGSKDCGQFGVQQPIV